MTWIETNDGADLQIVRPRGGMAQNEKTDTARKEKKRESKRMMWQAASREGRPRTLQNSRAEGRRH